MNLTGENLLTLAIVAVAVAYLVHRAWSSFRGQSRGGCGACANCPSQTAQQEPQVLSVDSLLEPLRRPGQ
jgi:hypothetical protein